MAKIPEIVKPLAQDLVWDVPTSIDELFLTFDDGPDPEVTPEVMSILEAYGAKANFFCVGNNAQKHPTIIAELIARGHRIGNHTQNHNKGWETGHFAYLKSALECDRLLETPFFRPPYGRITKAQASTLKKRFKLIMWDVLSGDFDPTISPEKCVSNVVNNARRGSIIVFHDSQKSKEKMLYALPRVLDHFSQKGFKFLPLSLDRL